MVVFDFVGILKERRKSALMRFSMFFLKQDDSTWRKIGKLLVYPESKGKAGDPGKSSPKASIRSSGF